MLTLFEFDEHFDYYCGFLSLVLGVLDLLDFLAQLLVLVHELLDF